MVREHELAEFELEHQGFKIRIRKDAVPVAAPVLVSASAPVAGAPAPVAEAPAAGDRPLESGEELAIVTSPIVGTFYRAPEPGAPAFAEVGTVVRKGQVLCIIEAMKLMNEIDSEYDGEVVKVYVENGQPVQYRRAAVRDPREIAPTCSRRS